MTLKRKGSRLAALLWRIKNKPLSPKGKWIWGLVVLVYILLPTDLLPDPIPLLGWIDDFGVLYIFLRKAMRSKPT